MKERLHCSASAAADPDVNEIRHTFEPRQRRRHYRIDSGAFGSEAARETSLCARHEDHGARGAADAHVQILDHEFDVAVRSAPCR
jgi:hypothetical protein